LRNTFAEKFYQLAKEDKRLNIVVADISPAGAMNNFRKDFPERFVNTGVAEQIMIGMVAGMAMRGLRPFCLHHSNICTLQAF
jgi:transketolase